MMFRAHTVEDGPIGSEEAVLETLSVISGLEGILLQNDIVDIRSGEQRNLITTMAVKNAKERELRVVNLLPISTRGFEVEYGSVGILHANAPALHGRYTPQKSVILALCRGLGRKRVVSNALGGN